MSVPTIYNFNTFSIPSIQFEEPTRIEEQNLYLARANIKNNSDTNSNRLFFQTPVLKTRSAIQMDDQGCWIEMYLENEHENFINFLHHMDEHNIKTTHTNSDRWFNQHFEPDVIEDFYVSTIRNHTPDGNDHSRPHTFIRLKIPTHRDKPYINIYDQNKDYISYSRIKPDMSVIAILDFKGLSFQKNKFICDVNIVQLKAFVEKNKVNLTSYLSEIDEESKAKELSKINACDTDKPTPQKEIQLEPVPEGNQSELSSGSEEEVSVMPSELDHPYPVALSETIPQFSDPSSISDSEDIPSIMPEEGNYNKEVIDDDMIRELAQSKRKKHIHRLSKKVDRLQKDALHTAKELQRFSQNL